jgi:AraC-like DNA-binding protein
MSRPSPIRSIRRLPGVEIAYLDGTGHCFPKHSHDEFVIGANIVGRESIWLDGKCLDASIDEVTVVNPGQLQASEAGGRDWRFVSLYVDPDAAWRLAGARPGTMLERAIMPSRPQAAAIRRVGAAAMEPAIEAAELTEALADLLAGLFADAGRAARHDARPIAPEVALAAERLRAEWAAPPALDALAGSLGVSPVHLVRAFNRQHGLPPYAWLNALRLKEARRRLLAGEAIAAVAADLGFADQAHLTRRFKAAFGITPGAYRRLK